MMDKYEVSIVLAAYNEELCIVDELKRTKDAMDKSVYSYEIIIVDDASTDQTPNLVKQFPDVKLIRNSVNKGSGGARKVGTLAAQGEIVVWSDVDMIYPNDEIPRLIAELKEKNYDQVVGARKAEKGTLKLLRTPAKWFVRQLAMFLSGQKIPDLNSGLRAFRKDVSLKYLHLIPRGFSCVSTLSLAFLCNGDTVGYIPIEYKPRVGKSKFHPIKDTYSYLLQVIRMIMYFNPLKIFLPIAFFLGLIGVGSTIRNIIKTGGVQQMDVIIIMAAVMVGIIGLLADLIVAQHKK